jgi:hypothetical protein
MKKAILWLIVGLLFGAACSDELRVIPDVAAETVNALTAADVSFSGEVATVQEAIDAHMARLDQLDTQVSSLGETVGEYGIRLDAIDAKLGGEDPLTALQAQVAELSVELAALKATIAKPACGDGFHDLGTVCLEQGYRPEDVVGNAVQQCALEDLRLCTATELYGWCLSEDPEPTLEELTATRDADQVLTLKPQQGAAWMDCAMSSFSQEFTTTETRPYRCCRDK